MTHVMVDRGALATVLHLAGELLRQEGLTTSATRVVEDALKELPYTHRNGETTPPEVEGWYWIMDEDGIHVLAVAETYSVEWNDGTKKWYWSADYDLDIPNGVFYGPIPQPTISGGDK